MITLIRKNKEMVWSLAVNDFITKYAGSIFGTVWAFIQPVITILIYTCVFQFGLKSESPVANVSYIFWFSSGMIPWFFFSDALRAITNVFIEYSYLVKKVVFNIELLPVIKILSCLFVHLIFIILLMVIGLINKEEITVYAIQIIYYLICSIMLVYAFGKLTSAIILFFKDLGQIVNIVLDIGLWATPIIWSYYIVPENYRWIIKMNPLFYIIEGYRNSLINRRWFFEDLGLTIYFWIFIGVWLLLDKIVFNKLHPQFADVL